jgi:translation initiation factor IF-2
MTRLRVYELARDLNMTNKVLLEKLGDLDISVKSHMSALDEDIIDQIKSSFFSTPEKKETIEETRIKPTVIRRRRKKVKVEVSATFDAEPAAAGDGAEEADKEAIAAEAAEESVAESETPKELEAEEPQEASAAEVEEKPAVKEAKKPKKAAKKEPSAKIIKLPVKPPQKPLKEKKAEPKKAKAKVEKRTIGKKAAAPPAPQEAAPAGKDTKKRKRKKKYEESDVDKKFLKKKISFKKKAVVEGEDLYAGGYRPRKQRQKTSRRSKNTDNRSQSDQTPNKN